MRYIPRGLGLLVAFAMVVPVAAGQEKKDSKDKWVTVGSVQGKLAKFDSAQKTLHIQGSVPYVNGRSVAQKAVDREYQMADDVQVLLNHPPIELDDKGKPKKPTAADLKKAVKGPPGMPGKWFPGDMDSLKNGQVVTLVLKQKKEANKFTPKKKDDVAEENKPVVATICIVAEPRN